MSGLGLDHVFPFPRDDSPPSSETQEGPERGQTPQVVVHSTGDAPAQRSSPVRAQPEERSPSPLSHVFPWQRSPTPPPFVQMQVFEPFEIGDLTPTPSEWSDGQYPSAQQSPARTRKEAGLIPERAPTPRSAPEMAPQLRALTEPEPAPVPEAVPAVSPEEELITTPVAEEKFISLANTADDSQPDIAEEAAKDGPASQVSNVEDAQAQIDIPAPISDPTPIAVSQEPSSTSQPEDTQTKDEKKSGPVAEPSEASSPSPVPISRIANRYMLYDTDAISYLRREYNICGVLIGTLPSHPQQNVFLGTPLELMPEDTRRLVEVGAAYIVDDVAAHKTGIMGLGQAERKAFLRAMEKQGVEAQRANQKKSDDIKKEAMRKNAEKIEQARRAKEEKQRQSAATTQDQDGESSLFAPPRPSSPVPSQAPSSVAPEDRFYITPSISHPPLLTPPASPPVPAELPKVPRSYPLFAYLHSKGFFMSPGLRFGCQYCVYPGDPLRFHSHFLAVGMDWDDEFDLMQLVGGGRLGTGVKKGFLVGGKERKAGVVDDEKADSAEGVRAFSIEWSGM